MSGLARIAVEGETSGSTPLPAVADLQSLLQQLLGRDVEVTLRGKMPDLATGGGVQVGTYADRSGTLRALLVADLALAARAGAAIALAPPAGADDAVSEERLPPALYDNAREILNVTASLFNTGAGPHLTPQASFAPGGLLPPAVAHAVRAYVRRLDLHVAVKGYGVGNLSVVVL